MHPDERPASQRYRLRPHVESQILVGRTSDGRQFATAPHYEGDIVVFFSPAGEYLDAVEFPDSVFPDRRDDEWFPDYLRGHPRFRLDDSVECVLEPIEMQRFFLEEYGIGIEDYPAYWRQVIDDPDRDREAFEALPGIIEGWLENGNYVLLWNDDYWINRQGEIVAT